MPTVSHHSTETELDSVTSTAGRDPRVPGLTLLYHPDLARVGERAVLLGLVAGGEALVSRREPGFSAPASGAERRPLGHASLSRQPIRLRRADEEGALHLDATASRTPVAADGEPVTGRRTVSAAELERGLVLRLGRHVVSLLHRLDPLSIPDLPAFGLIGESPGMVRLRLAIRKVADLDVAVLLRGETGSGKELAARAVHRASRRRDRPFLAVNMAAIPASLAAAELFGAVRGAFTGAERRRRGLFEQADGGTLFLDEIGETPAEVQALLLRALETGEIRPVGSEETRNVDVRVISATDADLEAVDVDAGPLSGGGREGSECSAVCQTVQGAWTGQSSAAAAGSNAVCQCAVCGQAPGTEATSCTTEQGIDVVNSLLTELTPALNNAWPSVAVNNGLDPFEDVYNGKINIGCKYGGDVICGAMAASCKKYYVTINVENIKGISYLQFEDLAVTSLGASSGTKTCPYSTSASAGSYSCSYSGDGSGSAYLQQGQKLTAKLTDITLKAKCEWFWGDSDTVKVWPASGSGTANCSASKPEGSAFFDFCAGSCASGSPVATLSYAAIDELKIKTTNLSCSVSPSYSPVSWIASVLVPALEDVIIDAVTPPIEDALNDLVTDFLPYPGYCKD